MEPLVLLAARENAEWCDAVCRAAGAPGRFEPGLWSSATRTPPFYPDAVTLDPGAAAEDVLARIDASPGASVKDSFARLDLAPAGFSVLFEAAWIAWAAPAAGGDPWQEAEVERWTAAHPDHPPFTGGLLADPGVRLLSSGSAGFVLHRSGSAVGVSNLFGGPDPGLWRAVVGECARRHPGVPVVGYEHGEELDAALGAGAEVLGPLRVWVR